MFSWIWGHLALHGVHGMSICIGTMSRDWPTVAYPARAQNRKLAKPVLILPANRQSFQLAAGQRQPNMHGTKIDLQKKGTGSCSKDPTAGQIINSDSCTVSLLAVVTINQKFNKYYKHLRSLSDSEDEFFYVT